MSQDPREHHAEIGISDTSPILSGLLRTNTCTGPVPPQAELYFKATFRKIALSVPAKMEA